MTLLPGKSRDSTATEPPPAAAARGRWLGLAGLPMPGSAPAWYRYGVAIAMVAAAAAVRLAFMQRLGMRAPFVLFYPAVVLAALYGGAQAGLLATILSGCVASFAWIEPVGSLSIKDPADWLTLALFLLSCTMISLITAAMERARAQSRQAEADAAQAANVTANEFRLLAEAMPQIVWITRADGWNTYFNRQWVEYTGLTLEESYGHGWNKPFHPDDQARAGQAHARPGSGS